MWDARRVLIFRVVDEKWNSDSSANPPPGWNSKLVNYTSWADHRRGLKGVAAVAAQCRPLDVINKKLLTVWIPPYALLIDVPAETVNDRDLLREILHHYGSFRGTVFAYSTNSEHEWLWHENSMTYTGSQEESSWCLLCEWCNRHYERAGSTCVTCVFFLHSIRYIHEICVDITKTLT